MVDVKQLQYDQTMNEILDTSRGVTTDAASVRLVKLLQSPLFST